jgi:hypothetical protein
MGSAVNPKSTPLKAVCRESPRIRGTCVTAQFSLCQALLKGGGNHYGPDKTDAIDERLTDGGAGAPRLSGSS